MIDFFLTTVSLLTIIYALISCYWLAKTGNLASPISLYAALVMLHFALPGFFWGIGAAPDFVNYNNRAFAIDAALYSLASLLAIQFGALVAFVPRKGLSLTSNRPVHLINWKSFRIIFIVILLICIGLIARLIIIKNNAYFQVSRTVQGELEGPFYAAFRLMEVFPLHALCIIAIRYWRLGQAATRLWRNALLGMIFFEVLYWLPSGRKEEVILALLLPLMIKYLLTKKLPQLRILIAFFVFVLILIPFSYYYRSAMIIGGQSESLIDFAINAAQVLKGGGREVGKSAVVVIVERLSLLEPLSACIRIWEKGIWEPMLGSSYAYALLGLIPRFLWPGKPGFHYGTDFGHAGGFLSPGDWQTSVSVTFFGESYLNFGVAGVLPLVMMGLIFGAIYRKSRFSVHRETWTFLYVMTLPTILYIGGTFALYFGGLIKLLPFYYIVGRFMESPNSLSTYMLKRLE